MRKKCLSVVMALAVFVSVIQFMPMAIHAQVPQFLCKIIETDTEYETLDSAIDAAQNGQTIQLLSDITHGSMITANTKSFIMDINDYLLTVDTINQNCICASGGFDISIVDNGANPSTGAFIANASDGTGLYGLYAFENGSTITVEVPSAISVSGNNGIAVYAYQGGAIDLFGDVYANGTGSYGLMVECGGVAHIDGDIIAEAGVWVKNTEGWTAPVACITGDITSTNYYAVNACGDAHIDITGNITGQVEMSNTSSSSAINITGDINFANGSAINHETGTMVVTGDITAPNGFGVSSDSTFTLNGNIVAKQGVHSNSSGGNITINGNITVNNSFGVYIYGGATVTVNGVISGASPYIRLDYIDYTEGSGIVSGNYYVYSTYTNNNPNFVHTVYVLVPPEDPFATNVSIAGSAIVGDMLTGEYDFNGTTESGTTYKWLENSGTETTVFDTMNIAGVFNNPSEPATFTLDGTTLVSRIMNYHWNNSYGVTPGTIGLQKDDGTLYGPWDAHKLYSNVNWEVRPYIELPAGTYTIIDSSHETWANNSESGYRGMATVYTTSYSNEFTPIEGATSRTYNLTANDVGKMIVFEVTVSDLNGLTGASVRSSSIGPVISVPMPGTLQFEASYHGTYEGYNGWIRVERIDGSDGIVSVDYVTADGTATAGVHYTPVSGTLTWNDGDSDVKVIPCVIINDSQYNGYLYFEYALSSPTGGAELGSQNSLTVEISDDDNPPTPTGLTAFAGNGEVTLEWDEVTSAYYKLYYSTSQDSFTEENSVGIYDGTSYKMTGLRNGTTYYFAVKSAHNIYYSEPTETVSATPKAPSSSGGSYAPPIRITTVVNGNITINSTKIPSMTKPETSTVFVSTSIVNALVDKAVRTNGTGNEDILELSIDTPQGINSLTVTFGQIGFDKIVSKTDASLRLTSPFISIRFDDKALKTISEADASGNVVISAVSMVDHSFLGVEGRPVYDLNVVNGNIQVSDFDGGQAMVTIPYTLQPGENPNAIVVYFLADDGTLKTVRGHYDTDLRAVVFKTTHFSYFVIGYNPVEFADVGANAWYKNAVDFIAARGITSGTGDNSYSPEARLTRAQFVVLLMNAYQINTQSQDISNQIQNFTDAGNTYYTGYLLAAKNLGIVSGVGNNLFAPDKEISRQEVFVILFNALRIIDEVPESLNNKQLSSFNDASDVADWANQAISALIRANVVSGSNDNLYPRRSTTRAEIAQLLYNQLSK